MIHEHAQTLLYSLARERQSEEASDHPIIWVAHSLGGILVKRALELGSDTSSLKADNIRSIFVSTYAILFLGTPHNGADIAKWGLILQNMANVLLPKRVMDTNSQMVRTCENFMKAFARRPQSTLTSILIFYYYTTLIDDTFKIFKLTNV